MMGRGALYWCMAIMSQAMDDVGMAQLSLERRAEELLDQSQHCIDSRLRILGRAHYMLLRDFLAGKLDPKETSSETLRRWFDGRG